MNLSTARLGLGAIFGAALTALAAFPAAAQQPQQPAGLDAIRQRGQLICGVNAGLAGFAQPDSQGVYRGFDVDFCRAMAAAILGDASKVRYVATTTQNRFTALQSGEVDVLSRNTTWTLSRDTSLGLEFNVITFFDGQGFMVRSNAGVQNARGLDGATICVQPGTTTEQNLADWARANRIRFTPVVIERLEEIVGAYLSGRCDAFTTDVSGLAATRATQQRPADHTILPDVISKEPLGPSVRHGDQRLSDIMKWVHFAMVTAEELGVTAANVDQMANDPRPDVQRLLGRTGDLGPMLGLQNNWAANVIKAVGNYGEVFTRNLQPIGIQRGPNALWNQGGLMYAPPVR
ncbi:amino acid ABC transporter substrate-binding protein [Roseomonas sp. CCTCC AB2023176]|uniref:amino acid ABC transporter substrate-binding protein n=1 Tax=Roseomonas sp. CCTCC AB2023176 TaxID=3342640 RepID=UPI0035D76044